MNFNCFTRIKLGITSLVLLALFSNLRLLLKQTASFHYKSIGRDFITLNEKRFAELKKTLPSHGVVGYLSDVVPEKIFVNATSMAGFFAAQYALAPVTIANTPDKELVVGNFHRTGNVSKISKNRKLVIEKRFGKGLYLFRRERE